MVELAVRNKKYWPLKGREGELIFKTTASVYLIPPSSLTLKSKGLPAVQHDSSTIRVSQCTWLKSSISWQANPICSSQIQQGCRQFFALYQLFICLFVHPFIHYLFIEKSSALWFYFMIILYAFSFLQQNAHSGYFGHCCLNVDLSRSRLTTKKTTYIYRAKRGVGLSARFFAHLLSRCCVEVPLMKALEPSSSPVPFITFVGHTGMPKCLLVLFTFHTHKRNIIHCLLDITLGLFWSWIGLLFLLFHVLFTGFCEVKEMGKGEGCKAA